ncbi:MAG: caspase family protein [Cyanobacteria bacterium P01_D01_bin.1]
MSRDALVVGINRYQHLQDLKAPAVDAEAIAQRLSKDKAFQKVSRLPEAITPPTAQNPLKTPIVSATQPVSQKQLKAALKQLFLPDSGQAPDTALFYFSGHGIADTEGYDKGYLATSDSSPRDASVGISMRWLQWLLSQSPVKQQIVWLDCCHSGSLMVDVGAANPGNGESRDRCFIASSREFESSWEDLNSPYSTLTKALLEGLDPTELTDRWVDTAYLVNYVSQAMQGELQKPVCSYFGEPINLTRNWRVADKPTGKPQTDSGICPYKGLEFFDCNGEDPKYFFGRERLVDQLLDKVNTDNFVALVGASGNGKSSVLRAGLLHQIQLGRRIAGSEQWRIRLTRPDKQPMQNLALAFVDDSADENLSDIERAGALGKATELLNEGAAGLQRLVQAASAPRVILVIDQFEEVFTRCESEEEREQFFDCLMGALSGIETSNTANKLCVIVAMRADFVGKCLEHEYSGLARRVQQSMVSVLPMARGELEAAICKPAQQVDLQVEPSLVTAMLNEIAGAPGSLPLLQYTLKELWQQRQNSTLLLSTYQDLGGIRGTLDKRATEIYNSFDQQEQQTVQHIFQQLTQLGEGTEDTRRRVFQSDLVAAPQHSVGRVQQVIDRLSNKENRLLVTSEVVSKGGSEGGNERDAAARMAIVDVAHEALIRHWRLLRGWIEQNRDLLRKQRKIEAEAIEWRGQGKQTGYLLQGLPLIEATQFEQQQADSFPLSDSAKAFIRQSRRQRRWNQMKVASWLIIPAVIAIGVVEHNLRSSGIKADFARLDEEGGYAEKFAVESLVEGCAELKQYWLPTYVAKRLFGNCESLLRAPLANADLRSANLRSADLRSANLSSANLRSADLFSADLSSANLSSAALSSADLSSADLFSADLFSADLSSADLFSADLSYAILLNTDLRAAKSFPKESLNGETSALICNSLLPSDVEVDRDRDCDKMAGVLHQRYPFGFETVEAAQSFVDEQRQKTWE